MSDITSALEGLQNIVLDPKTIRASGAGKAYQSVAQSAAIAVQDSVDNLRNISAISTTVIGVAMAEYLATQDPKLLPVIQTAQGLIDTAADQLKKVGEVSAGVLSGFPAGNGT